MLFQNAVSLMPMFTPLFENGTSYRNWITVSTKPRPLIEIANGSDRTVGDANLTSGTISMLLSTIDSGSEKPLVLAWTKSFGGDWNLEGPFQDCPAQHRCVFTHDRNLLENSSALLFHIRDFNWSDLPPTRRRDQYYVFVLWESPNHTFVDFSGSGRHDFFNLTLTYRRDSDVTWPYGDFIKAPSRESGKLDIDPNALLKVVSEKKKLVAWFVSNCQTPSRREKFVERLKQHVSIDVYGKCGGLNCTREKNSWKADLDNASSCHQALTKNYKFYLSFENSLCRDYITEKFYGIMDDSIVIPVVLERKIVMDTVKDREAAKVLNGSFIAVDDFLGVEALASYLKYLDKNVTAYMRYFEWRKQYRIVLTETKPACELCRIVNEKKERKVEDVGKWWNDDAQCHVSPFLD